MSLFKKGALGALGATLLAAMLLAGFAVSPKEAKASAAQVVHARVLGTYSVAVGNTVKLVTAALPPDPTSNFNFVVDPSCFAAPMGTACMTSAVTQLNEARTLLCGSPYKLPPLPVYFALSAAQRIYILQVEDRLCYGETIVGGVNDDIVAATHTAMLVPTEPGYPASFPGGNLYAHSDAFDLPGSNPGTVPNDQYAYGFWNYADGVEVNNNGNVDCPFQGAPDCWDHRHGLYAFGDNTNLAEGASSGVDSLGGNSTAWEMVDLQPTQIEPFSYTWADAEAAGAGDPNPPVTTTSPTTTAPTTTTTTTNPVTTTTGGGGGNPPPVTTTPVTTTTATPPPTKTTPPVVTTPTKTKPKPKAKRYRLKVVQKGGTVTLSPKQPAAGYLAGTRITAKAGKRFERWVGPCSGGKPVCRFTTSNKVKTLRAVFAPKKLK